MVELDARHGPFPGALDRETISRYAAATNDTDPRVVAGDAVPPTFPVILVFEAQYAANAAVRARSTSRAAAACTASTRCCSTVRSCPASR